MIGAYIAAAVIGASGSFLLGIAGAIAGTALVGAALEMTVLRQLYRRSHLSQVLATFALILIANEIVRMIWGSQPILLSMPPALSGPAELLGFRYPAYRLVVIGVGLAMALFLWLLVTRTRAGMWVRAGASDREMAEVMGVDTRTLFTLVFAIGAARCSGPCSPFRSAWARTSSSSPSSSSASAASARSAARSSGLCWSDWSTPPAAPSCRCCSASCFPRRSRRRRARPWPRC